MSRARRNGELCSYFLSPSLIWLITSQTTFKQLKASMDEGETEYDDEEYDDYTDSNSSFGNEQG